MTPTMRESTVRRLADELGQLADQWQATQKLGLASLLELTALPTWELSPAELSALAQLGTICRTLASACRSRSVEASGLADFIAAELAASTNRPTTEEEDDDPNTASRLSEAPCSEAVH